MGEIQPALTPEEWATIFSWEDVEALRYAVYRGGTYGASMPDPMSPKASLWDLAERIAALLPPRDV